jgi:hypothetical protein
MRSALRSCMISAAATAYRRGFASIGRFFFPVAHSIHKRGFAIDPKIVAVDGEFTEFLRNLFMDPI